LFSITISEKHKTPCVTFSFRISQKDHSVEVLNKIQKFFGCGRFTTSKRDNTVEFYVRKFDDILLKIIPHFESYPLLGSKQLNFESFKEAAFLVKKAAHLTENGILRIKELKDNMNTKRSFEEKYRFCFSKPIHIEPQWIIGFIDAEGSFYNRLLLKHKGNYEYIETESTLSIGQNFHDVGLIIAIKKFFGDSG